MLPKVIALSASALLLGWSFPYFNFWPGAYFFAALLLWSSSGGRPRVVFFKGMAAGIIGYSIILYWIYPTVYTNTASVFQSSISLLLLTGYISLYLAAFLLFFRWLEPKAPGYVLIILLPSFWTALEYLRTKLFTGFPWAVIGYSQWNFLPALQTAEYGGVYLVSFLLISINVCFYLAIKKNRKYAVCGISIFCAAAIFGLFRMNHSSICDTRFLDTVVLQPNIDQYKKFDERYKIEIAETIKSQIESMDASKPDLILWPETSLPPDLPPNWLEKVVRDSKTNNIIGAFSGCGSAIFNSALLYSSEGIVMDLHRKTHLVPFGEFVPFRKILEPYFEVFNQMGDTKKGTVETVFTVNNIKVAAPICSENLFPEIIRKFVQNGAEILFVITNNAWFGKTAASFQHFTFNVLRAIESGRYIVQSANTGISGAISPDGIIEIKTESWKPAVFLSRAYANDDLTFYSKNGDIFAWLCIIASICSLFYFTIKKLKSNKSPK